MKTIVIVCGERDWVDSETLFGVLDSELAAHCSRWLAGDYGSQRGMAMGDFVLRHGDCDGADKIADAWATRNGVTVERFPAQWTDENGYHPEAGPVRNKAMAKAVPVAARCIAFWSGKLRTKAGKKLYSGTFDMIQAALSAGIECRIVPPRKS